MKKETEVPRDLLTQQLLTKATPITDLKVDFTAQVLAQIEAKTQAQRAKIYEPLLPNRIWRWIGIGLSSMVLLVLGFGILTFGLKSNLDLMSNFTINLQDAFATSQLNYLPELLLAGVICFCWLFLDYLCGQLRKN
ncbi:hypothetical protein AHMF7605_19950 [Adhaeribacter arboris]|uniref:DUF5056 domain-containing protein n=1 Tax=Adhaeribacter arboris TaxID=2072846 RepID=A0A2T2YJD4_9BACT|nr:hypothetical protein [Adhaeribacter arboris]PSR55617.1 hypothetical protein AHMF7605_19950 [Adhaeribacter arboris]